MVGLATVPAVAQDTIYDNGPSTGNSGAWTINFGFAVSNTFSIDESGTVVNGLQFSSWLFPGDVLQTAEVSLTSQEFGGTTYFDQTLSFTTGRCTTNAFGYNVCPETAIFTGVTLNSGVYWLNLQNATVNTGDPAFWDENAGPSLASQNSGGTIPSESFTLLGREGSGNGTSPEPGSIMLFASGLGCLAAARRKFL
jgi:hypothetical protein